MTLPLNKPQNTQVTLLYFVIGTSFLGFITYISDFSYLTMLLIGAAFFFHFVLRPFWAYKNMLMLSIYSDSLLLTYPRKFFKGDYIYKWDEIVSIDYIEEDENSIKLTLYKEGRFTTDSFEAKLSFDDLFPAFKYLFDEKEVAILHNGRVFIPVRGPKPKENSFWQSLFIKTS